MLSFETERLILKPVSDEDAAFFVVLYNTPKWLQFIGDRNVHTIAQAQEWIKNKMAPQIERLGYGTYIIIRKSDNVKIGTCGLYDRDGVEGIDIGFAFLPEYEKQGYAFEAASKVKEVAFNTFHLPTLHAITTTDNIESQHLIGKLGLTFRKMIRIPHDDAELMLYSLEAKNAEQVG